MAGEEGTLDQVIGRYASARRLTDKVALSLPKCNDAQKKLHNAVASCWEWFELRHYPEYLRLPSSSKVIRGYSCKRYKLCAVCAIRRSIKVWHSIEEKVLFNGFAPSDLALVTITMKSSPDLSKALESLRSFYQSLRQGRNNFLKRNGSIASSPWAAIDGWIGHMEITKTVEGWHPHYHFLVAPKVEYKHLFDFEKIHHGLDKAGIGFWNCEFSARLARKLYSFDRSSYIVHTKVLDDLGKGIAEVAKYLFKFGDMEPSDIVEAHFKTHRMRLGCSGDVFTGWILNPMIFRQRGLRRL